MKALFCIILLLPFISKAQVKPFGSVNAGIERNKAFGTVFQGNAAAGLRLAAFHGGAGIGISSFSRTRTYYPVFAKLGFVDSKKTWLLFFFEPGFFKGQEIRVTNISGQYTGTRRNNGFYYNISGGVKLSRSKGAGPVITVGYSSYNIHELTSSARGFFSARAGILF